MRKIVLFISLILVAGVLILDSCGGSANKQPTSSSTTVATQPTQTQTATTTPASALPSYPKPAGLETEAYNNEEFKFSIDVPKGWTLRQTATGQYNIFTWTEGTGIPSIAVVVRNFMQPILIDTFVTKFETEVYGSSYKETKKQALTYQDVIVEYTMTTTDAAGASVDVIGDTVYRQHGNNFYVISELVEKSDPGSMLASLRYCGSTFATHLKMG
jgi:hypothetical protein